LLFSIMALRAIEYALYWKESSVSLKRET